MDDAVKAISRESWLGYAEDSFDFFVVADPVMESYYEECMWEELLIWAAYEDL